MNQLFVVLYFCILSGINGSPQNSNQNNYCSITQFQCNSGECIEEDFLCDGIPHCFDSSDEILNSCGIIKCPSSTFQCDYGACISRNTQCNGIVECADGSDEKVSLCGTKTPSPSPQVRNCLIPGNPANGKYLVNDQPVDQFYVTNSSKLFVNCDAGYIVDQSKTYYSICLNGAWMPNPPICSPSTIQISDDLNKVAQTITNNYCSFDQFQCNSGECIAEELACNGNPECADSSDETSKSCSMIHCPRNTFQCDYGACINENAQCNGYIDCADGSDESSCKTVTNLTSPAPVVRNCLIPANNANGVYAINDQPVIDQSYAPNLSTIFINCDEDYSNDPPETFYSICRDGVWMPDPPTCSRSCSSLNNRRNQRMRCNYIGKSLRSCNNPVHGVIATGPCFENSGTGNCSYFCSYGIWVLISNIIPNL